MPVAATLMLALQTDAETTKQYGLFQVIFIGIYNIPFLFVSTVSLIIADSLEIKSKIGAAKIGFAVSLVSSLVGIFVMFLWGLGSL